MDIYIDVLIVINAYMTWLLLGLTSFLSKTPSAGKRRAAASALGGVSSLIALIPTDVKLLAFTSMALKIISCLAIVAAAYRFCSAKKFAALSLAFLGSNMLVSAALIILRDTLKLGNLAVYGGFVYLDISPLGLIVTTAVIYLLICRASKLFNKNLGPLNSYRVDFKIGCKVFSLDGFADTGNTVRDLFSGLPVIICTGIDIESGENFRAVPYKTVSGEGVLYAFRPESLTVTDESGRPREVSALVAGLPKAEGRRAVFNPEILSEI